MFQNEILPGIPRLLKMRELTGISIPSLQIFLLPLVPYEGLDCHQLRTQPWLCTSLNLFGLKPAGSWIWSFAWQSLVVSANWHPVWVPVCQVSSDRSRHQGGRGGCVFAMNRASWLSAGYSSPTRSQPNIIQSLRPHLKMFHHHSESKQGLAEPREGKWRKAVLWTPSGFSCCCFCTNYGESEVGCQDQPLLLVVLPASLSLLCGHPGRRAFFRNYKYCSISK